MSNDRNNPSAIVIGAGMTGIGVVIKLRNAGITRITLLEKAATPGGTWRENTYPGVACDVPSHAYTYTFAPNPGWSSLFASGAEIQGYIGKVFHEHGVDQHVHFNQQVTRCRYHDGRWQVTTATGEVYEADLLFSATGFLHQPAIPDIAGLDRFAGPRMHSARWDHSVALEGRRIGVIGTGSSAAQIIPQLIHLPGTEVTVFQRTAQWIVHTDNKPYSESDQQRFQKKPALMERIRRRSLAIFELGTTALTSQNPIYRLMHHLFAWNARRNLKARVKDPVLRAKLTPDYTFGCKRVILNGSFYDDIQRPNAHLVTEKIDHIEADGVVTADGCKHGLDVLVLATGFDASAFMRPMEFRGRDGLSIDEVWKEKISAYRSMLLPGFPNCFLMLGPNSPIGNYSVTAISEMQADYAIGLIRQWQAGTLERIEVRQGAFEQWRSMLKARVGNTIWASGCQSWYLDADGDPLTWPDSWKNWVAMMKELRIEDLVPAEQADDIKPAANPGYY